MALSIEGIISKYCGGRLSSRPEYYSGRGNNTGDLNSDMIEMVYGGVKAEVGEDAAKAFVSMVGEMTEDASATTFLVSVKRLAQNGWTLTPRTIPTSNDAFAESIADAFRENKDTGVTAAFCGFAELGLFGGGKRFNPTSASNVTGAFLRRHQDELPDALKHKVGGKFSNHRRDFY